MSEHLIKIDIVTPQRIIFSGVGESISVPGTKGPFQVLHNHAPIVSSLDIGVIKILNEDQTETLFATDGGFVEVVSNNVSVIVETAEEASTINTTKIAGEIDSLKSTLDATTNVTLRDELKKDIHKLENRVRVANRL
ncbi:MAG: ATP synthase F1 subunit epsilon [Ignavibacteria bacterium]|nr:ATP synthase F1 subunit epsilon [Ignavibacteria bacterium]